jgi:hypothetical protein
VVSGIYGIKDTENDRFVYVGRAFDICHRFVHHIKDGHSEALEVDRRGWFDYPVIRTKRNCLAYLLRTQIPFESVVLDELPKDTQIHVDGELWWSDKLLSEGHPLANGDSSGTKLISRGNNGRKNFCPYTPELEEARAGFFDNRPYWIPFGKRVLVSPDSEIGYALRKLRRDREDLHKRVLAGEISPHAAMIEAGFRKKTLTVPADLDAAARTLLRHFDPDELYGAMIEARLG